MENFTNWFRKKKQTASLQECSVFGVDQNQSDSLYGGFKEYKPPIYEHESAINTGHNVTDLLSGHSGKK